MGLLVTEGTSVYEIDEECLREKEAGQYCREEKKREEAGTKTEKSRMGSRKMSV